MKPQRIWESRFLRLLLLDITKETCTRLHQSSFAIWPPDVGRCEKCTGCDREEEEASIKVGNLAAITLCSWEELAARATAQQQAQNKITHTHTLDKQSTASLPTSLMLAIFPSPVKILQIP